MKKLASLLTVVVLGTGLASAHHGWSGYDETKPLRLTGVIKAAGFENPHGFVDLQVDQKVWRIVLAPPVLMEVRGLSKEKLKPGNTATIIAYQNRKNKNEVRAERITIDGKTTELR